MLYSEIAEDVYYREDLEDLIPEGRRATPLLPGILGGEAADCFFTYGDIGSETVLFDLIRVTEHDVAAMDCGRAGIRNDTGLIQGVSGSAGEDVMLRYAELYPQIRDMIANRNDKDETEKKLMGEFRELIPVIFESIPADYIERWFPEYS